MVIHPLPTQQEDTQLAIAGKGHACEGPVEKDVRHPSYNLQGEFDGWESCGKCLVLEWRASIVPEWRASIMPE